GLNAMSGTLVVGDFSGADSVKVTSAFNNFNTAQPVIVNSSGTFDTSGSTVTQTLTTLEVRGGLVKSGTSTLQTNNTITGLATSTTGDTVAGGTITGNLLLAASTTINVADSGTNPGLTISAPISSGAGVNLTKGGAGTLTLNAAAANTY